MRHCARGKLEVANSQLPAIAAKMQCDILALITDELKGAAGQPYRDAMTSCQLKNIADMIPMLMLMIDGNCEKSKAVISSRIKRDSASRSPKPQSSTTVVLVAPDAAVISSAFPSLPLPRLANLKEYFRNEVLHPGLFQLISQQRQDFICGRR